jgi:dolichyl-diphosphooligosaccharide--protein glycosyltransferase
MSDETSQAELPSLSADAVLEFVEDWYHVIVLAGVATFMLWLRAKSAWRYIRPNRVYFSGNDAWYHYRQIVYTVREFPATMPFDPWTYFPNGTSVGQFGTLFDQLIATAALIVGLGDPSARTIAEVTVYAPAVFGTLVVLPTYFIGKRIGGRTAGTFAAVALAIIPGMFLSRSVAGVADHNIAEPLFQSTAVLATMLALHAAEREKPVWEQVRAREWTSLRGPLGWSALAGVAASLYLWMWPPGVLLVGILGVFYLLQLTADYVRGHSPEHVALVGAVSMSVTALLSLTTLTTLDFTATQYSLLQPLAAASVALFSAGMAWLAREWDRRDLSRVGYPTAVFGTVAVGTLFVYVLLPDLFSLVQRNLVRFVGFNAGATQRTIGEAQPMLMQYESFEAAVLREYGLTFFVALVGAVGMLTRSGRDDADGSSRLLVLVWFTFLTAAAFTQVRFNYYLAVPVAVLNGYALYWLLSLGIVGGIPDRAANVSASQIATVGLVLMLVLVPAAAGINNSPQSTESPQVFTPMQIADSNGPTNSIVAWGQSLDWLQESTPAEGAYGGADNTDALDYYGTFSRTGDYDYPEGYYGVMSWWDYGHWITVQSERIPNANPFQQGATTAANFLLAPNESAAQSTLEGIDEEDAETRYVMVDWQMASVNSKFGAPTVFYDRSDVSQGDFFRPVYRQTQGGAVGFAFYTYQQRYYDSMMVRLYRYHGSAQGPQTSEGVVVSDWVTGTFTDQRTNEEVTLRMVPPDGKFIKTFDNMSEAEQFVEQDGTARIGGVGGVPTESVPALEHYRLVNVNPLTAQGLFQNEFRIGQFTGSFSSYLFDTVPSRVKTFERVPGATVQGEAPAGTTVTASVEMAMSSQNTTFVYRQHAEVGADGEFTMTLPYSSTGYDEWGTDEGYTDVSVTATGPYSFTAVTGDANGTTYNATAHVTEGQVVGENGTATQVSLTPVEDSDGGTNNTSASLDAPDLSLGGDGGADATADVGTPTTGFAARIA